MKTVRFNGRLTAVVIAAFAALFLSGCKTAAELRAERIERNPGMYMQLDAPTQVRVSQGQIAVGDTSTAVWLALGSADKITSDTTATSSVEIWQYYRQDPEYYTVLVPDMPPPGFPPPPPGALVPSHYETRTRYITVVSLQVQFNNGIVTRIQQF